MLTTPDSSATVVLITVNAYQDLNTLCMYPSVNTTASSLLPLSGMISLMPSPAAVSLVQPRLALMDTIVLHPVNLHVQLKESVCQLKQLLIAESTNVF